jgi:hypothetical protein
MALSIGINRDVQVSFPIADVKEAIEKVCAASKKFYQIESRDAVMNTYTVALVGGFAVIVPATIQLKKVSDTETQIILTSNKATNSGNQANEIVDKFFGLVSKALSGETIDEKTVSANKSGCLGIVVLFIILFSLFTRSYSTEVDAACKFGQCEAIAKSTKVQCKNCAISGTKFCNTHKEK